MGIPTLLGAGPEFCLHSGICNGLMMEQNFESLYDVGMKTAKLNCHVT